MHSSRPAENLQVKSSETSKVVSLMLVVRDLFGSIRPQVLLK